ncbi:MAG: GNAT family N-acetyltransferase [Kofleriaceae bacterium]
MRHTGDPVKLELLDPYSATVEPTWRALEQAHPPSYFLSWGWIENWLACLPREHAPRFAVIRDGGDIVSAGFLARRTVFRHRVLPSRALYLNATGVPSIDNLWIEYNGLLGRDLPLDQLLQLISSSWDELFLPGVTPAALGGLSEGNRTGYRIRLRKVPAFVVDLAKVRDKGYLPSLGGQTRSQVRRAQREAGAHTIEVATSAAEALGFFNELVALHTKQWRDRGEPGAFADPWIMRFHRRLIAGRFAHGEIQLVRARTEDATFGCLYNFSYRGRILQYQSGFEQYENRHMKPGYVCHAAAIEHAAKAGHAVYDFLAGDMRYKDNLSTDRGELWWACVQRKRARFLLEDRLREWVHARRAARAQQPT